MRQVTVTYRKRKSKESPLVCKSKPLIEERVAVHRLHRLGLIDEELHQACVNQVGDARGADEQVQPLDNSFSDDDGEPPWEIDIDK